MKKVEPQRFQKKNPENISFQGVPIQKTPPSGKTKPIKERKLARKQGSLQASQLANIQASKEEVIGLFTNADTFKKRLSTASFRFSAEELEGLDELVEKAGKEAKKRVFKNDIVRMALNWILKDHEKSTEDSVVSRVYKKASK